MYSKNQSYIIKINPLSKVNNLIRDNQFEQALDLLKAIKPQLTQEFYTNAYTRCQYELKQYLFVISYLKNKEIIPTTPFLYLARSYKAIGQYQDAIKVFLNFTMSALNREALSDYIACYEALKQYSNAIKAYRNYYFSKMDKNILFDLVEFCEKIGDVQATKESYQLLFQQGLNPTKKESIQKNELSIHAKEFIPSNKANLKPSPKGQLSVNAKEFIPSKTLSLIHYSKEQLSVNAKEFIPANRLPLKESPKKMLFTYKKKQIISKNDTLLSCQKDKLSSKASEFIPSNAGKMKNNPNSFFQYYNAESKKGISAYNEQWALLLCDSDDEMLDYFHKVKKSTPSIEALDLAPK